MGWPTWSSRRCVRLQSGGPRATRQDACQRRGCAFSRHGQGGRSFFFWGGGGLVGDRCSHCSTTCFTRTSTNRSCGSCLTPTAATWHRVRCVHEHACAAIPSAARSLALRRQRTDSKKGLTFGNAAARLSGPLFGSRPHPLLRRAGSQATCSHTPCPSSARASTRSVYKCGTTNPSFWTSLKPCCSSSTASSKTPSPWTAMPTFQPRAPTAVRKVVSHPSLHGFVWVREGLTRAVAVSSLHRSAPRQIWQAHIAARRALPHLRQRTRRWPGAQGRPERSRLTRAPTGPSLAQSRSGGPGTVNAHRAPQDARVGDILVGSFKLGKGPNEYPLRYVVPPEPTKKGPAPPKGGGSPDDAAARLKTKYVEELRDLKLAWLKKLRYAGVPCVPGNAGPARRCAPLSSRPRRAARGRVAGPWNLPAAIAPTRLRPRYRPRCSKTSVSWSALPTSHCCRRSYIWKTSPAYAHALHD